MTSMREVEIGDIEGSKVKIDLQAIVLVRSRKRYDLYRVSCRIEKGLDLLHLTLIVRDDRVFVGEVAPLIKHSLHVAFGQLADATFSYSLDDTNEQPESDHPHWLLDLLSLRRDHAGPSFEVGFGFRGLKKVGGELIIASSSIDDAWRAVPIARERAHDALVCACAQTRSWKLTYEQLEEL